MSNRDLTFVRRSALESVPRLVAYALADHRNETTGKCCPSMGRLVASTGLCERSVRQNLRALEAMGVMTAGPLPKNGREGRRYYLRFELLPVGKYWTDREEDLEAGTEGGHDVPGAPHAGGTTCRGQDMPGRGAPHAGEGGMSCRGGGHVVPPNQTEPKGTKEEPKKDTRTKKPSISELCIEQANQVSFFLSPPPEVMQAYRKYQDYRTKRARGLTPEKRHPWKPEAAERDIKRIETALLTIPPAIVADQILTAVEKGWQTAGVEHLRDSAAASATPRQSFQQADRSDRQNRRHGPEAIPCQTL